MRRTGLGTRTASVVALLGLVVAACGDDTGGNAAVVSTPTASATSGASLPPPAPSTTVSPPATSMQPTTTGAAAPSPVADTVFVTVDRTLVGWWDGAGWIAPAAGTDAVPPIDGEVLRSVEALPDTTAGSPSQNCFPESGQAYWQIDAADGVRASGMHDLQPRPYEEIGPAPAHIDAIRDVLDAEGVDPAVPVEISRVIRLDVEGDGVDEVLIEAVRLPPPPGFGAVENGDYSIVLLRRVAADDSVQNITLHVGVADLELAGQYVLRMDLAEPIDVNGDGAFELAARWSYYEGGGVSLFELGAEPSEVLVAGCGV